MLHFLAVQTLGISDSTPKPENRLKALLWPTIRNETDVDYVTSQGFWICFVVAILQVALGTLQGGMNLIYALFGAIFFFLSGVGVRMRSVFAAACAFFVYSATSLIGGAGIVSFIFMALLFANLRGTWLSSRWRSAQTEPPPVPMDRTLFEKLSDRFPIAFWPVGRYFYYVLATIFVVLTLLGIVSLKMAGTIAEKIPG
jgi:hypothetical protein